MKLPIKKATIWKAGGSAVITIPTNYIKNKLLEMGKEYDFEVEVTEHDELL